MLLEGAWCLILRNCYGTVYAFKDRLTLSGGPPMAYIYLVYCKRCS